MTYDMGQLERLNSICKAGLDTLYAQPNSHCYECWTYSDGQRVRLKPFYSLEGLQMWARKHRYGIVYMTA